MDGLPWRQATSVQPAPLDATAANSKMYLAAAVSRKSFADLLELKPAARSSGRPPQDYAKQVPQAALDASWRSCELNHEDSTVRKYVGELKKQRNDHLGLIAAINGTQPPSSFVKQSTSAASVCHTSTASGSQLPAKRGPPVFTNSFVRLSKITMKVEQLKQRLMIAYGEVFAISQERGSRVDEDAPVAQASEAQTGKLEAELERALAEQEAAYASIASAAASASTAAPAPAASQSSSATIVGSVIGVADPATASLMGTANPATSSVELIDVQQEHDDCEAELGCSSADSFFEISADEPQDVSMGEVDDTV
uniref:Uncharacterized protein n=1 Tax=Haptolina ericina TaxID=156174 RepID=A0A7S3BM90_9EUKA|mmetsp:Transcript_61633/g.137334  ORF Transcript_61633/g.137334 Transcript_61633/m.137334 type:complete len:311 (+) Transcript_61633:469-1401(+)